MRGNKVLRGVVGCLLVLAGACSSDGGGDNGSSSGNGNSNVPATPGGDSTGMPGGDTGTPGGDTGTGTNNGTPGGGMDTMNAGTGGDGDGDGDGDTTPVIPTVDIAECGQLQPDSCREKAEGVYAIKTTIDVWWQDDTVPPLVDPGRGNIVVYLMGDLTEVGDDGAGKGLMKGCGTELPVFKSDANCDAFQIEFPDELWDKPTMPTFETTGMTSGFDPGDILNIAQATGLVGISLTDKGGTWPTPAQTGSISCPEGSGAMCFPDHDDDGNPGITVKMGKIGQNLTADGCGGFNLPFVHRGAPLDALGALDDNGVKAETLFIGVRTTLGGAGQIGCDCASGAGESTATHVDSRVWDCMRTDDQPCMPAQSAFVDESAPNYNILNKGDKPPMNVTVPATQGGGPLDQTPSAGPISEIVRLGDLGGGFTCANVRDAF